MMFPSSSATNRKCFHTRLRFLCTLGTWENVVPKSRVFWQYYGIIKKKNGALRLVYRRHVSLPSLWLFRCRLLLAAAPAAWLSLQQRAATRTPQTGESLSVNTCYYFREHSLHMTHSPAFLCRAMDDVSQSPSRGESSSNNNNGSSSLGPSVSTSSPRAAAVLLPGLESLQVRRNAES